MHYRRKLANAIRALSMDAIQRANSGHPGAPMGMADVAEVLWNDFLKHNPTNPHWPDRDRFVLSNGHSSMLLYSLLHLTGYDLPIEEIRNFRQLHSKTPGHPEYGRTHGVETTTGPLGQGLGNAVGMAIAERMLASQFNREGHRIIDHYTYVIAGDGCLMEGVSHEVCSLAGLHGLGKLIVLYDDNGISIDGNVTGWLADDTPKRFEAYGWHTIPDVDGHDPTSIHSAIANARTITDRPSLICCKNVIGWGSPNKQGTEKCHGSALGEDEVDLTREAIDWSHAPFVIPEEIYAAWDRKESGQRIESDWKKRFAAYRKDYPELAAEFERRIQGNLPAAWSETTRTFIETLNEKTEQVATRKASYVALDTYAGLLPELVGGSADLTESNLTKWSDARVFDKDNPDGNYLFYGVREFGMCAINNGISLHGGFIPYGGTFLMFCEYALNALRMAALMGIRNIFVYSHDSIAVGEDGPTHQPVEQVSNLRRIPNMQLWRPCDWLESAIAWQAAIERVSGPTCLIFTRQPIRHHESDRAALAESPLTSDMARGGYIRRDCQGTPEAIIIATGSEVPLAMDAARILAEKNHRIRVVSMPSTNVFDEQEHAYRESVLPSTISTRVVVEAGLTEGWHRYVGPEGKIIGIDTFGESAPCDVAFEHFGLTVEKVIEAVEEILRNTEKT
uniref:Transketolase n=1 Tax=Candidatus Kentrum sp. TUN TaxID=2126343 RepID=A0A450ZAA4_9GAMM|nr:MAG: transketolase [Candidatus Kentron sp. TUN]VFK53230.1 MAG: transketolase [Candidatus Kentron sp. TUN]VFK54043.1 MAG: transketolase [Candidatus Kentron sp. TUN]